uniref:Uncharacterized protein n=1 Tax=Rhizophora mucronata TaxID=61149 RepID=A0A2P2NI98_RHIMU
MFACCHFLPSILSQWCRLSFITIHGPWVSFRCNQTNLNLF